MQHLIHAWFEGWATGEYRSLPLAEGFTHTSPFGVVEGRDAYLALVEANEAAFLGFTFEIHDELYGNGVAAVRYTARKGRITLDAGEFFRGDDSGITAIVSYYDTGGGASYD